MKKRNTFSLNLSLSTITRGSHSEVENLREYPEDPKYETMSYTYHRYNDEGDAETHVHAFLTTWQEPRVTMLSRDR